MKLKPCSECGIFPNILSNFFSNHFTQVFYLKCASCWKESAHSRKKDEVLADWNDQNPESPPSKIDDKVVNELASIVTSLILFLKK